MRTAALAAIVLSCSASAQWHEPLNIRNHRPADLAFLRLTPRSRIAPPGARTLTYSFVVANEFRRSGPIDEDAETLRVAFEYREGLEGGWELFGEVSLLGRGGGVLDPLIDWWHNTLLGDRNLTRDGVARGRSTVSFPGGGPFGSEAGIGDVSFGAAYSPRPGALLRVGLKLPTGYAPGLLGSGAFDVGVAGDLRVPAGRRLTLDLNAGLTLQGRPTHMAGGRRSVASSSVALTWLWTSRDAWTVQWSAEQSPTRTGLAELDGDHRVMSLGYQRRVDDMTVVQVYLSEGGDFRWARFPGGATVGPDLTIGVRIIRRHSRAAR